MLNTKKLLFILPDVVYIAEMLPAKKKGDFNIASFRQINGEFLDDNEFIKENIQKLFAKIEADEYQLILPDFLFTNTIVEAPENSKNKIKEYLEGKLLPSLDISTASHYLEHFVLTEFNKKAKIQLTALEKDLLSPIAQAATANKIKIVTVNSLSWLAKSLISLEPSLSLLQMGERLYLAQHYIGLDQSNDAELTDVEKIAETIKTLKGAEPSIQTIYLLSNELVEEKLKDLLKGTIPVQQLANFKDEESKIPSYVKAILEAGAKTLSIKDFQVPGFDLEAVSQPVAKIVPEIVTEDLPKPEKVIEPVIEEEPATPDLSQFAAVAEAKEDKAIELPPTPSSNPHMKEEAAVVIKNKSGVSGMLKMLFIVLAVFLLTVAIGVALGLAFIVLSQKMAPQQSAQESQPAVESSPAVSPSPSPEPEITTKDLSVLIVNATTKAGYAGKIEKLLTADFKSIDTANAKGEYEEGLFVLIQEENQALLAKLTELTDLDLDFSSNDKLVEDPDGNYDLVVVLAK